MRQWGYLAVWLLGALAAPLLGAATITWSGAGDGATWSQGTNWAGNTAPGASDVAMFDGTVAPATVTGVSGTIQALQVDSGSNADLDITFQLNGNLVLTGNTGALYLGSGDAVVFDSTSATVRNVEIQDDLDSAGGGASYTFNAAATLHTTPRANAMAIAT